MNNTMTPLDDKAALTGQASQWLTWVFWAILGGYLVLFCVQPISDPDFWWHLKSGEVMLQQGGLLHSDPFNYTSDTVVTTRESIILKGYWLWQLAAAGLHHLGGIYGIFALKAITLLLLAGVLLREMYRQAVSPFAQQALIGLAVLIAFSYSGLALERPQVFSFLFALVLLGMVAQVRLERRPNWLLLPLMVLWANVHGGYVVGIILLLLFSAGAILQYRNDRSRLGLLLGWAAAGIVVSLANPAGWNAIIEVANFSQQGMTDKIAEYTSSWAHFSDQKMIGLLWLLAALHGLGLLLSRRVFWPDILISVFLLAFGVAYLRNTSFITIAMLPMTGWYLGQAGERFGLTQKHLLRAGVLMALATLLVWQATRIWPINKEGWPIHDFFPVKMAAFLQDSELSGHLFNDYEAGGYLNWALFPKWQTFIDGRGLDENVFNDYQKILAAHNSAPMQQIDVIALIMTPEIYNGPLRVTPLLKLVNSPLWFPVYFDRDSFVLAKATENNRAIIDKITIDKLYFMNTLLSMFKSQWQRFPADIDRAACYADMLIITRQYADAQMLIAEIERMHPGADVVQSLKNHLNKSLVLPLWWSKSD